MNNLNFIKQNLSNENMTFLIDIDRTINVDKSGKYKYHIIFGLNLDKIENFISNIRDNDTFLIHPFISTNCRIDDPMLCLSRQFLVSNYSDPQLIQDYLYNKIDDAGKNFGFDHDELDYYLIFKFKRVYLTDCFT
jgi:hypothetical protein